MSKKPVKKAAVKKSTAKSKTAVSAPPPSDRTDPGQLLANLIGDISRVSNQVSYLSRSLTNVTCDIGDELGYLQKCVQILFEAAGMEMPKRIPKLLDARVELTETIEENEICEIKIAYTSSPHPFFGNYQILLGSDDHEGNDVSVKKLNYLHPIVQNKVVLAFEVLKEEGKLKENVFYYARLGLIHAGPATESSQMMAMATVPATDSVAVQAVHNG